VADAVDLANESILFPDLDEDPMTAGGPLPEPRTTNTGKIDGRTKAARAARASAPRSPQPRKTPGRSKARTDYRAGIEGLGQMAAFAISFKAPADAAAVAYHTPPIAKAVADLANEKPEVAAVLDRLLSAGPYAALLTAVTPLVIQLLVNHKVAPAGIMGSVTPEEMLAVFSSG
jgi:hypothetical protein